MSVLNILTSRITFQETGSENRLFVVAAGIRNWAWEGKHFVIRKTLNFTVPFTMKKVFTMEVLTQKIDCKCLLRVGLTFRCSEYWSNSCISFTASHGQCPGWLLPIEEQFGPYRRLSLSSLPEGSTLFLLGARSWAVLSASSLSVLPSWRPSLLSLMWW